jgi:hypothetical protein
MARGGASARNHGQSAIAESAAASTAAGASSLAKRTNSQRVSFEANASVAASTVDSCVGCGEEPSMFRVRFHSFHPNSSLFQSHSCSILARAARIPENKHLRRLPRHSVQVLLYTRVPIMHFQLDHSAASSQNRERPRFFHCSFRGRRCLDFAVLGILFFVFFLIFVAVGLFLRISSLVFARTHSHSNRCAVVVIIIILRVPRDGCWRPRHSDRTDRTQSRISVHSARHAAAKQWLTLIVAGLVAQLANQDWLRAPDIVFVRFLVRFLVLVLIVLFFTSLGRSHALVSNIFVHDDTTATGRHRGHVASARRRSRAGICCRRVCASATSVSRVHPICRGLGRGRRRGAARVDDRDKGGDGNELCC